MIEKRTMIRILIRLDQEEHLITWIDKGVYYINDGSECTNDKIIDWYTKDNHGCLVGNSLFKELGLIDSCDGPIEVLTCRSVTNKTIGNIKILKSSMIDISDRSSKIIALLEIISNIFELASSKTLEPILMSFADSYSDLAFEYVIAHNKYKVPVIMTLEKILLEKNTKNKCAKIFMKYNKRCQERIILENKE